MYKGQKIILLPSIHLFKSDFKNKRDKNKNKNINKECEKKKGVNKKEREREKKASGVTRVICCNYAKSCVSFDNVPFP